MNTVVWVWNAPPPTGYHLLIWMHISPLVAWLGSCETFKRWSLAGRRSWKLSNTVQVQYSSLPDLWWYLGHMLLSLGSPPGVPRLYGVRPSENHGPKLLSVPRVVSVWYCVIIIENWENKTIRLSYYIQFRRRWTESGDVLGDKNRASSCQKRGGGQDLGVPSLKKRNKVSDFLWQSSLYNSASQVANSCYTWKILQLPALRLQIYFLQR